jgi:hypothetical protein
MMVTALNGIINHLSQRSMRPSRADSERLDGEATVKTNAPRTLLRSQRIVNALREAWLAAKRADVLLLFGTLLTEGRRFLVTGNVAAPGRSDVARSTSQLAAC